MRYLIASCYQGGTRLDRKVSDPTLGSSVLCRVLCNIMIFRIIIFLCVAREAWSDNTTTEALPSTTVAEPLDVEGNMCEVCSCKDGIVDCSERELEDHFDDKHWPSTPMLEVSFAKNKFVHVRAFPVAEVNRLILRENSITTIDDAAFLKLVNLTEIDLSHNQLTTPLLGPDIFQGKFSPSSYEPLEKLTVLKLGYNALHSLHQSLFEHMENLRLLSLEGNPFRVIDSATMLAVSNLHELEELDMSYCNLDDLPEHLFHTPRNLKKLNLTGNRFSEPPGALEDARALEHLTLDSNPFTVLNKEHAFPVVASLKQISLCCMHNLTEIGAGALSGLTGLTVLHIEGCPLLETINENALVRQGQYGNEWPPLKKLELSDNSLKYLPAKLVGNWNNLTVLSLTNNAWSCDCDNQYLIESLLPGLGWTLMGDAVNSLTCSAPPEHFGKNLTSLSSRHLRCLDAYDARPERDASVLVGMLIGVLLAIPVILLLIVLWKRGFLFCGAQGPASFSRAFYKRADNDDDF